MVEQYKKRENWLYMKSKFFTLTNSVVSQNGGKFTGFNQICSVDLIYFDMFFTEIDTVDEKKPFEITCRWTNSMGRENYNEARARFRKKFHKPMNLSLDLAQIKLVPVSNVAYFLLDFVFM